MPDLKNNKLLFLVASIFVFGQYLLAKGSLRHEKIFFLFSIIFFVIVLADLYFLNKEYFKIALKKKRYLLVGFLPLTLYVALALIGIFNIDWSKACQTVESPNLAQMFLNVTRYILEWLFYYYILFLLFGIFYAFENRTIGLSFVKFCFSVFFLIINFWYFTYTIIILFCNPMNV